MKNIPKVSVIIPVYNTAPYLKHAFDSIANQTLHNIQIIVINDGSTDNSIDIIDDYCIKDSRFEKIEQINKGLSEARNIGFTHSKGKYVYFMDSDDFLEKDCLQSCFALAESNSLDFVCFDAENFGDSRWMQSYNRNKCLKENIIYSGYGLLNIQLMNYCYKSSVCLNFICKESLDRWFHGFYPGIIHEDQLFTINLLLNSKKCQYINKAFFKRRNRNDSIMKKRFSTKNVNGYKTTTEELLKISKMNVSYKNIIDLFLSQMLNSVVWQSHELLFFQKVRLIFWIININKFFDIKIKNYLVCFLK